MSYIAACVIGYSTEAIILYLYASGLFVPQRRDLRKNIISLATLYLLLFCIAIIFKNRLINITAFFLANTVYLVMQYSMNWFLCFFHSTLITALMALSEIIVYVPLKYFLPNSTTIENTFYGTVVFSIFSKLLFFLTVLLVFRIFIKQPISHPQDRHSALFLIFVPSASVFIMLVFLRIIDGYNLSGAMNDSIALACTLLLFANLLVFGIYQYIEAKNEKNTQLMLLLQREANQAEYYEMLNIQNENQRVLIHDIRKHLQSIGALNEKREYEKIRTYIEQLSISSDLKAATIICDHKLLNSILCRYDRECREKNIAFHTDIRSTSLDLVSDNHITSLFCNLLDNAVEAAFGIPNSFIELSCSVRGNPHFIVITIINSCKGNPFRTNSSSKSLAEQNLPTQKENRLSHGFGLKSIRKTVNHYNGDMQMYYNESNNTFHTIITLKI